MKIKKTSNTITSSTKKKISVKASKNSMSYRDEWINTLSKKNSNKTAMVYKDGEFYAEYSMNIAMEVAEEIGGEVVDSDSGEVIKVYGSTSKAKKFTVKASTESEDSDTMIDALWDACYDVDNLQDIDYEASDTDGTLFIFTYGNSTNDYESRESQLISALESAGYNVQYDSNNGSNIIVLRIYSNINAATHTYSTGDIYTDELETVLRQGGITTYGISKSRLPKGHGFAIFLDSGDDASDAVSILNGAGYTTEIDSIVDNRLFVYIQNTNSDPKFLYRVSYGYSSDIVEMDDETSDYQAILDTLIDNMESTGETGYLMNLDEAEAEYNEDEYEIGGNHGLALIHNGNFYIEPIGWSNEVDVEACTTVTASIGKPGTTNDEEYYKALGDGVVEEYNKYWESEDKKLSYEISETAITFEDNGAVFIQPLENITPNWEDLESDIEDIYLSIFIDFSPRF